MAAPETPGVHIEENSQMLLELLRDAVIFVDVEDGRIIAANRAAEQLYGYTAAQLLSLNLRDIVVSDQADVDRFMSPILRGEISDEGRMFSAVHRRSDGSILDVDVNARLAMIDGREVAVAIMHDVTKRLRMQRELEQAYAEVNQILDAAADGMRIVGRDFTVLRVNRMFAELAGVDLDSAVGMKCYDAFAGDLCHTEGCPLVRVLAGKSSVECEAKKYRADGSHVTCLLSVRPYIVDGEVAGIIEDYRDITERKRAEEMTAYLATHDTLTGLPNRGLLLDHLQSALVWTERDSISVTLLFCDIDGFKEINDRAGHAAGDEVLKTVAQSLKGAVRKVDTVARLGGDEFVVLAVSRGDEIEAEAIAAKVVRAVAAAPVPECVDAALSTSVGIATHRRGEAAGELLRRADSAMYVAKRDGGGRYHLAE